MKRIAQTLFVVAAFCGGITTVRAGNCRVCEERGLALPPVRWSSLAFPTCTPTFAGGAPLAPAPDDCDPQNVLVSQQFYQGPPAARPPERQISEPIPRPKRPGLDMTTPAPDGTRPRPEMSITPKQTIIGHIHLLILADGGTKDASPAHLAGADLFEKLFRSGIRSDAFGRVEKMTEKLDADAIFKKLAELPVQPDDTLVVYYSGGAIWDENSSQFVLTPSGSEKKLPREELRKAVVEKHARLTMLFTDPATNPFVAEPPGRPQPPEPGSSSLETWFFANKGVIDVHASSGGEFAAARGEYGGCFTLAFIREFSRPAGNWADMLESVKFTTNNIYKSYRLEVLKSDDTTPAQKTAYRNQESQVPILLTPGDNIAPVKTGAALSEGDGPVLVNGIPQARLGVRLPASARLWIDGESTKQTGLERKFELQVGPDAKDSICELRIEMNNWYGVYRVKVGPGQTTLVDLQVPSEVITTSAK